MEPNKPDSDETRRPLRLLRTKLFVPRVHPDLVMRSGLIGRLNLGLTRKLTLIIAPAGFGKSTLVSSWTATLSVPLAWLSLDERDNDPIRFWTYFISALQTQVPAIGEVALSMLKVAAPPPIESILTELLNDTSCCPDNLILVLDDYHVIESSKIHQGMIFLLENLPAQIHLVIASRAAPPFPLPLMRGRRELVELSLANLRFSPVEADLFFSQSMGLKLDTEAVNRLVSLTEGWIAGLQLAALSIQDTGNASNIIQSFSGSHRFVFDYLAQEVQNRQPPEVQAFLLQTAILDRFCGSLMDAVLGPDFFTPPPGRERWFLDSQSILEYLERANLFIVPLDQQRQWYRYHHLFSDFLQTRLTQEMGEEKLNQLNQRASEWFEKNGFLAEAIKYALSAKNFKRMALLIVAGMAEFYSRNELNSALGWMSLIPKDVIQSIPELCMVYAWTLLATSQTDYVEEHLHYIEGALGVTAETATGRDDLEIKVRGTIGEILCLRSNLAFHRMDLDQTIQLSRQALSLLSSESVQGMINSREDLLAVAYFNISMAEEFKGNLRIASESFKQTLAQSWKVKNYNLIMFSYSHLAGIEVIQGQLQRAMATYQEAIQSAREAGTLSSPMAGIALAGSGGILYEQNRLEEAEKNLLAGIELGRQWANWEIVLPAYLTLSRLRAARNQASQAALALDELDAFARKSQVTWGLSLMEANRALFWARSGDRLKGKEWLEAHPNPASGSIPIMAESEAILRLYILLTCEDYSTAAALAAELLTQAEAGERWGRLIEVLTLHSLALYAVGDKNNALAGLEQALVLAHPEGFTRLFLDLGRPMKRLLNDYLMRDQARPELVDFTKDLLALFDGEAGNTAGPALSEAETSQPRSSRGLLTERELEVLRLIADGYTNQEIADRLVVSLNTVKTHVKAVLGQLEVSNRTQATARARELGLL